MVPIILFSIHTSIGASGLPYSLVIEHHQTIRTTWQMIIETCSSMANSNAAASMQCSGSEDTSNQQILHQRRSYNKISPSANLSLGTWNCGGLSKIKKDFIINEDLDVACVTETHEWRDSDPLTIYSDPPPKSDSWAGVGLILNKRISKYVMNSGSIGSRITFVRLCGLICNLFIIGVYIPQKMRTKPSQKNTYDELEKLLMSINTRDCVIILGFNSRLARSIDGQVGKWSIHQYSDKGGERLQNIMNIFAIFV